MRSDLELGVGAAGRRTEIAVGDGVRSEAGRSVANTLRTRGDRLHFGRLDDEQLEQRPQRLAREALDVEAVTARRVVTLIRQHNGDHARSRAHEEVFEVVGRSDVVHGLEGYALAVGAASPDRGMRDPKTIRWRKPGKTPESGPPGPIRSGASTHVRRAADPRTERLAARRQVGPMRSRGRALPHSDGGPR